MCLGVPGRVNEIDSREGVRMGRVQFGGIQKWVCLAFLPDVEVADWVIVHAGFAISRIDEGEAVRTLELLRQLGDFSDASADGEAKAGGDALH